MKPWLQTLACAALLLCVLTAGARAQEGVGERIGEQLDQTLGRLREDAKDIAAQLREGFEKARVAIDQMSIEARVYARIRWDKALNTASVSVDVNEGGLAHLEGTVATAAAKSKAEELARDTVGVNQVQNALRVEPPAAP